MRNRTCWNRNYRRKTSDIHHNKKQKTIYLQLARWASEAVRVSRVGPLKGRSWYTESRRKVRRCRIGRAWGTRLPVSHRFPWPFPNVLISCAPWGPGTFGSPFGTGGILWSSPMRGWSLPLWHRWGLAVLEWRNNNLITGSDGFLMKLWWCCYLYGIPLWTEIKLFDKLKTNYKIYLR